MATHQTALVTSWIIALSTLSACGACSAEPATQPANRGSFPVAHPERRDVALTREYTANVRALRHAEIRSRIRGIVVSVFVDEGQPVKEGQRLFSINAKARKHDVTVAKAVTSAARAELAAAQLELENTQLLLDNNVVSPAELAGAGSKVEMLRAKVEQAEATTARTAVELGRAEIRAPFAGQLDRIRYKVGSAIDEEADLTTLTDATEVLVYFAIAEREYLDMLHDHMGGPSGPSGPEARVVRLQLADGRMFAHAGAIDAVGTAIDPSTGTISYRARFPNPDGVLKHGSSAKVVIETKLRAALVVPQKATFEVQGETYIYALDGDNTVRARKIEIKHRIDDVYVIDGGLGASDRFVLEGIQKLKDGVRIDVQAPTASPTTTRRG